MKSVEYLCSRQELGLQYLPASHICSHAYNSERELTTVHILPYYLDVEQLRQKLQ